MSADRPVEPPERLLGDGRFELLQPIGRGGMAAVYLARRRDDGQVVAVKVLHDSVSATVRARTRFLREARTTASLDHPNVVRVVEVGDEAPPYYIVMEYAGGGTLAHRVRDRGPRPVAEALAWTLQALSGLQHAHEAGVVHRDVKPHNLLLTDGDEASWQASGRLKLTDFGVAKWSGGGLALTGADDALGTLAYMAPEQRADPRRAEVRSDLYGVGATLFLLVTRRRPVDLGGAQRSAAVFDRLPPAVRPIVRIATEPDPRRRYASAAEMAEAVADAFGREAPPPQG